MNCHLQRIIDWHTHLQVKDCVDLENTFCQYPLSSTPWIQRNLISADLKVHPFIGPTLQCFQETCNKFKLSSIPGPLSPILNNPDFPPGMVNHPCFGGQPDIGLQIFHRLQNGKFLSYETLNSHWGNSHLSEWEYMQFQHFVHSIKLKHNLSSPLTPFEQLCTNSTPQRHVISALNDLLWDDTKADEAHVYKNWAHDLNMEISDTQWQKNHR